MKLEFYLNILSVYSHVSLFKYLDFREELSGNIPDNLPNNKKYSLIDGILAKETGVIHNLRYYGPFTERHFDEPEDASWFVPDKVKDGGDFEKIRGDYERELSFAVCKLFPSQGSNSINIYTSNERNLAKILSNLRSIALEKKSDRKDLIFLAKLLICCTNTEVKGKIITEKAKGFELELEKVKGFELELVIEDKKLGENLLINKYNYFSIGNNSERADSDLINSLNALLSDQAKNMKSEINSVLVVKAYIAMYLETQAEYENFYKILSSFININRNVLLKDNEEIKDDLIYCLEFKSINDNALFPYDHGDESKTVAMPIYNGNHIFDKGNVRFSNCVKSAMYSFCNSLLWDTENKEYFKVYAKDENGNITDRLAPVSNIFNGEMKSAPTTNDFYEWHKIVEGIKVSELEEEVTKISEDERLHLNPFEKVIYKNSNSRYKCPNEIKSGLITFLKVLEHITGRNNEFTEDLKKIFEANSWNFDNYVINEVTECIKNALINIIGNSQQDKIEVVLKNSRYIKSDEKYDIFGEITVVRHFNDPEIRLAGFNIDIRDHHTVFSMQYIEKVKIQSFDPTYYFNDLFDLISTEGRALYKMSYLKLFGSDSSLLEHFLSTLNRISLKNIIYFGNFNSCNVFNSRYFDIYETASNLPEQKEIVVNIFTNYFKSIPLDDRGTFECFISFFREYFEDFSDEILGSKFNTRISSQKLALIISNISGLSCESERISNINIDNDDFNPENSFQMASKYLVALINIIQIEIKLTEIEAWTYSQVLRNLIFGYINIVKDKDVKYFRDINKWMMIIFRSIDFRINNKNFEIDSDVLFNAYNMSESYNSKAFLFFVNIQSIADSNLSFTDKIKKIDELVLPELQQNNRYLSQTFENQGFTEFCDNFLGKYIELKIQDKAIDKSNFFLKLYNPIMKYLDERLRERSIIRKQEKFITILKDLNDIYIPLSINTGLHLANSIITKTFNVLLTHLRQRSLIKPELLKYGYIYINYVIKKHLEAIDIQVSNLFISEFDAILNNYLSLAQEKALNAERTLYFINYLEYFSLSLEVTYLDLI